MSGEFHSSRMATGRKSHQCQQCYKAIDVGCRHHVDAGKYDGEFYSSRTHVECMDAAKAYAKFLGLYGDEWPWFSEDDFESDDWKWMVENHPLVAKRLGWDEKWSEWTRDDDEPGDALRVCGADSLSTASLPQSSVSKKAGT